MAARIMPGLGLRAGYNVGEDGWGPAATEDLRKLSVITQGKVFGFVSELPDSPVEGDRWILSQEDSNSIGGIGSIIVFENSEWVAYDPDDGWELFVVSENTRYRFVSGAWIQLANGSSDEYVQFGTEDEDFTLELGMNATTRRIRDSSNSGANIICTVPNEATLDLPAGFTVSFIQTEDTQLTIEGEQDSNSASDVVLLYPADVLPRTRRQYSVISLIKSDIADTWYVLGDMDGA